MEPPCSRYDQFSVASFAIRTTIQDGKRRYFDALAIDYHDFPSGITDAYTLLLVCPVSAPGVNPGGHVLEKIPNNFAFL